MEATNKHTRDWIGTAVIIMPIVSFVLFWVTLFFSLPFSDYLLWSSAFLLIASVLLAGLFALIFRRSNRQRMKLALIGLSIGLMSFLFSGLMTSGLNMIGTKAREEHELRMRQEAKKDMLGNGEQTR